MNFLKNVGSTLFAIVLVIGSSLSCLEYLFSESKTLRAIVFVCFVIFIIFVIMSIIEKRVKTKKW